MSEFVSLNERIERFKSITTHSPIVEDHGLLKTLSIDLVHLNRIKTALAWYLYANLNACHYDRQFSMSLNILEDYAQEINALPNITPNGLVLPKRENCAAYNILHQQFADIFMATGLGQFIDKIQYPINVRLQNGCANTEIDTRPRSSSKPHTDIWAGDPGSAIVVFLSLLGLPDKAGIRFLSTEQFPLSFVRSLEDFDLGSDLVKDCRPLDCPFKNDYFYLMDPYLIHQTTKNGEGLRVSIDLRFIPHHVLSSDWMGDVERHDYFISFDQWCRIGKDYWLTTDESILTAIKPTTRDYTVGYPVNIRLLGPT